MHGVNSKRKKHEFSISRVKELKMIQSFKKLLMPGQKQGGSIDFQI